MDATHRPHTFSKEYFAYAENKKILEIFQNMLEHLVVNRPEKPIDFLYDLLMKRAVFNVPKVFVLGPPTLDRKLVCTTLVNKLQLIYLTRHSLEQSFEEERSKEQEQLTPDLIHLMKKRVEMPDCVQNGWLMEAFPKTRQQAFALRKAGVFPTHIVVIEDPVITQQLTIRNSPEVSNVLTREELRETWDSLGRMNMILDLHANSYIRRFQIGKSASVDESISRIIDFIRSKPEPFMSYLPRVLLFGPYGSGRKTMSRKLATKFRLVEVNYHEELRKAALKDSPLKDELYEIMKTSNPVPDELLVKVASNRLMEADCTKNGWVMINFPDTRKQVEMLANELEGFQINRAIFLEASLETCLQRVEPRRWDPLSGQVYPLQNSPNLGVAVNRLIQLPQDSADSVTADHQLYFRNIEEIKSFFRYEMSEDMVTEVDANSSMKLVFEGVQGALLMSTKLKLPKDVKL